MSDSVVKLRIDSKEYDANIKRAGDALTQYFQKVREGGGTLMHLDEGVLDAVKAMGELGTQAKNAKGGLRELTQATTDMTVAYRALTDEEKASPLGKAMQQSIAQMTERAGQMRDAMDDVNLSIKNIASDTATFDQIAGAANVATSGFQVLQGATKVLGIEMGDNVEVIAKLQAAMAVTNGLSQIQAALQKQSAFMQGVMAAKTALATVAQQAYAVATGEATAAQVAFNVAANANPYGLILGAAGLLVGVITAFAAATRESNDEVKDAQKEMNTLTASVDKAAEAYERLANKIKNMGIGGQKEYHMMRQALTDQYDKLNERYSNLGYNMRYYEQRGKTDAPIYQQLKEEHAKVKEEAEKIRKEIKKLDDANRDRVNRLNQYKRLDFSDVTTQAEAESAISFLKEQIKHVDNTTAAYGQLKRAIEYAEKTVAPQFKEGTEQVKSMGTHAKNSVKIVTGSLADLSNDLKFLQNEQQKATSTAEWETYQDAIRATQMQIKELKGELEIVPASIKGMITGDIPTRDSIIAKGQASIRNFKGVEPEKKTEVSLTKELGQITAGVSGIFSGIESLGIELPQGMKDVVGGIQGVMSILTGISTTMLAIEAIAGADALIPFSHGGIVPHAANGYFVPGNNFSGDTTPILANAGELVLNKSSQNNLASMITEAEGRGRGGNGLARVSGEQIWIALNAYTNRTGRGELVTWKD